jgi:tetratricopeptide (TPR) repeat protein
VNCPKCGFGDAGDVSCPRCGVVFAKLAQARPVRSAPVEPPPDPSPGQPSAASLTNILLLSVCFIALGMAGWYVTQRSIPPPQGILPSPVHTPAASDGFFPRGESSPPAAGDGDLVLPTVPATRTVPEVVAPPAVVDVPLPTLSSATISADVVRQVVALAQQYPEVPAIRQHAAAAHVMLAERHIAQGRLQDALAVLAQAKPFDPDPQDVARTSAIAYLGLREPQQAQQWAQAALAFGPDADMYNVLAQVYYLREELPRAIEAWQNSLALRESPEVRAALERALRESRVEGNLDERRLAHFIVKYEGDTMEDTGRLVLGSLERSYAAIKSMLGFEPAERVVVILLTRQDYAALGGPYWSAGRFDGKVRVPVRGLTHLDSHIESTLRHELTHAFIYARAGEGCPRWLQEGMAEYSEGVRSSQFGRRLAEKLEEDDALLYCLATNNYCDVNYFYPAATSLVEYLLAQRGMGGVRDLLSDLGRGNDIDRALQARIGRNQMELLREWKQWAVRR